MYKERMNYQQLKTKGVLAAKMAVRTFVGNTFCYLTYIRLIPNPSRKNGISVRITVKNETEWTEHILLTIKVFSDEIVIVGAPTDETPEIIEKVELMHRRNGMMIHKEIFNKVINIYKNKGVDKKWLFLTICF